jgi:hypothetical protein
MAICCVQDHKLCCPINIGLDYTLVLTLRQSTGELMDLLGFSGFARLETALGVSMLQSIPSLNILSGSATISFSGAATMFLKQGQYRIQLFLTSPGGQVDLYFSGIVRARKITGALDG